MAKSLGCVLALALSGFVIGPALAQSNSLTADPAPQLFDSSSGSFNFQNFMEATRDQENRANRGTIGGDLDAEIERFRQSYQVAPNRETEE